MRPVVGHEGRYSVTSDGSVYSHVTDRWMRLRKDAYGYLLVGLFVGGNRYVTAKVHSLVAEAFIGPAPQGAEEVDHIDGRRDNNRVENLRWVNSSQNKRNRHAPTTAASGVRGVRYREGKLNPWQAYCSTSSGTFKSLGHYSSKEMAAEARARYERESTHG